MRDRANVRTIHDRIDPSITVSMDGEQVVIRPEGRLDHDGSKALISAVNAAIAEGATALIDLERGTRPRTRALAPARRAAVRGAGHDVLQRAAGAAPSGITLASPGCIRVATTLSCWTIDLTARRLCRSATPLPERFIGPDYWIDVRQIWISAESVTALTATDSLISSRRPVGASRPQHARFSVIAS